MATTRTLLAAVLYAGIASIPHDAGVYAAPAERDPKQSANQFCPRSLGPLLRFDESTTPTAVSFLTACPLQSAFTCCDAEHDRLLRGQTAANQLGGLSPKCSDALAQLQCYACDGVAAVRMSEGVCHGVCAASLQACLNDYFAADGTGRLAPCTDDSLLCSRLSDIEEVAGSASTFCSQLGYPVAPEGIASPHCYDGSITVQPAGYSAPQTFSKAGREGRRRGGHDTDTDGGSSRGSAAAGYGTGYVQRLSTLLGFRLSDETLRFLPVVFAAMAVIAIALWKNRKLGSVKSLRLGSGSSSGSRSSGVDDDDDDTPLIAVRAKRLKKFGNAHGTPAKPSSAATDRASGAQPAVANARDGVNGVPVEDDSDDDDDQQQHSRSRSASTASNADAADSNGIRHRQHAAPSAMAAVGGYAQDDSDDSEAEG